MELRSLFQMIFGTKKQDQARFKTSFKMLNNYQAIWSNYDGAIYDNSQVRACIDAIARNGAKLNPRHIRKNKKGYESVGGAIQDLISKRPNELMNAYDFYYKIISELYLNNNAYVYISRGADGTPQGLYPLTAGQYRLLEYDNEVYIQFNFNNGQTFTASLKDDVIHLKRFFCKDEVRGGSNTPIVKTMSFKHILDEGIINAIKTTQGIKGILKTTKAMLKPEDIQRTRDEFVNNFMNSDSGIAGLDATTDFQSVSINPQTATDGQVKSINDEILNYFGLSDTIIQSKYDENQWNSFYESVLEPIAIMLSLEFTNKLFSLGEKFHGNEVMFESNRLQYASNTTKINLLKEAGALGILTRNEAREILNLAPVEDGDVLIQSLNYIDKDKDGRGTNNE